MRFEHKYIINSEQKREIHNLIDPFVLKSNHHKYAISSIYFDDQKRTHAMEKEEGLTDRKKIRFRAYSYGFYQSDKGILEVKMRKADHQEKLRMPLSMSSMLRCIQDNDWTDIEDSPLGHNFLEFSSNLLYRPSVMTSYFREAYVSEFDVDFRLTFDSYVSAFDPYSQPDISSYIVDPTNLIFPEDHFVFEVKTPDIVPEWYFQVVRTLGLQRRAISKFYSGSELLYGDL